ncbi:hypothetical protein PCASD_24354 [Puccinia coronata f. sp. avenae]|uniref:Glycosyl transferase CAP10 domain-containing protein n=1 Tax=Puccinia coronata f. sp. avenae TaxID=200324 RepID=A0A2N5RZX0_9BASI|nr:hypothetical protein PCASD_24354 [Puccinia coronata f. sp. avenae]
MAVVLLFRSSARSPPDPASPATTSTQDKLINGYSWLPTRERLLSYYLPDTSSTWSNRTAPYAVGRRLEEMMTSRIHHHGLPHPADMNQTRASSSPYYYHPNGLYVLPALPAYVNERHPILDLISRAEQEWNDTLARRSTSLVEGVSEYWRRYGKPPPYGFDQWWAYADRERVVLKDHYDQIQRDLIPFLALHPQLLRHRAEVMANQRPDTFTLSIILMINSTTKINRLLLSGQESHLDRARDLQSLINEFVHLLPPESHILNLTFTKHDLPAVQMTWARKQKMSEMAAAGRYFSASDSFSSPDEKLSHWANGCGPGTALYLNESQHVAPSWAGSDRKSFIYDHPKAMDVCGHPESIKMHGFTSTPGLEDSALVPLFTYAKTAIQNDVLVTPMEQWVESYPGADPAWGEKREPRLLWRGSTTGAEFVRGVAWERSQRVRLHDLAHRRPTPTPTESDDNTNFKHDELPVLSAADHSPHIRSRPVLALSNRLLDVAFANSPVQCDPLTCHQLATSIHFAPTISFEQTNQYKYLMDVDGNGWSGRFHRLMSTNSLVLKSTLFPEWYSDRVQPWVHYVPIKIDYSDLYDVMVFFRGDDDDEDEDDAAAKGDKEEEEGGDGDPPAQEEKGRKRGRRAKVGPRGAGRAHHNGHDHLAEKIATQGKQWAAEHWRRADMAAYMFRLVLEWRRVMLRGTGEPLDYLG